MHTLPPPPPPHLPSSSPKSPEEPKKKSDAATTILGVQLDRPFYVVQRGLIRWPGLQFVALWRIESLVCLCSERGRESETRQDEKRKERADLPLVRLSIFT